MSIAQMVNNINYRVPRISVLYSGIRFLNSNSLECPIEIIDKVTCIFLSNRKAHITQ